MNKGLKVRAAIKAGKLFDQPQSSVEGDDWSEGGQALHQS